MEFNGIKVTFETQLKIVGVIYDNKLNWSKMASEMASRGRQALGFLKRLGGLISKKDLSTTSSTKSQMISNKEEWRKSG